jgi:cell wall-associated NlpC family hydrolase
MTTGMAEAAARIAQLQSMLGLRSSGVLGGTGGSSGTGRSAGTSSTSFADTLADVLDATGTGSPAAVGDRAVELAKTYSGVRYVWGGTDPAKGLDCSGLVQLVYGKLGVDLPRVASDQAKAGVPVASMAQAQPGDLVFFGSPAHHVGIYVGDGKMIDAPRAGRTVGVHEIAGYGTVSSIRRVSGTASGATARVNASGLTATELLAASGLAGLSALGTTGTTSTGAGGAGTLTGPFAALFTAAGRRYGVDPALLSAVARTESSYNPSAVSSAGARGLMQLMPGTARSLGVNPDDPAQAVDGAARLLSNLMKQFDGRTDLALAGYNAGPGAVRHYGGVPPYSETRTYVQRVTRAWEALR